MAALVALYRTNALPGHVQRALENGVKREELAELEADALALGADRLLLSSDAKALVRAASSFDLIIDAVPLKHDINPCVSLLDVDGTLVLVGQVASAFERLERADVRYRFVIDRASLQLEPMMPLP